jgi:mono/diheme cytochrome c family protein
MYMQISKTLSLAAFGFLTVFAFADEPAQEEVKLPDASTKQDVTFEKDIRPIFEKSCFGCHGTEKQRSELRVDSIESILKGGKHGQIVVAGKSDQSPLVIAVARVNKKTAMPPKKNFLTAEEVGLVRAWIDQGTK